jgi:folate-binding protein YgfZ
LETILLACPLALLALAQTCYFVFVAETPASASTWESEYFALKGSVGLLDFSSWGKLAFSGPDCKKFLNGLVTNNILKLEAMRGCLSLILTPKGLLRADFEIYDRGEDLIALAWPKPAANLKEEIAKKVILSQTKMEDLSERLGLFYLAGPKAPELVKKVFGLSCLAPWELCRLSWSGLSFEIAYSLRLHPKGHWLIFELGAAEKLRQTLLEAGRPLGILTVGREALEAFRVERGIALYGVDMGEDTIPQEARLDEALSFDKGCYMGQEMISRVHHMGHINRTLICLRLVGKELPGPRTAVFSADEEVGRMTSCVWSPGMKCALALATVRLPYSRPKSPFLVRQDSGRPQAAQITM